VAMKKVNELIAVNCLRSRPKGKNIAGTNDTLKMRGRAQSPARCWSKRWRTRDSLQSTRKTVSKFY
jgi:hypothetical protein